MRQGGQLLKILEEDILSQQEIIREQITRYRLKGYIKKMIEKGEIKQQLITITVAI